MKLLQILSVLFTLLYFHAIPSLCANQFEWTVYFGRSQPFSPDQLVHHMQVAEAIIRDHGGSIIAPWTRGFRCLATQEAINELHRTIPAIGRLTVIMESGHSAARQLHPQQIQYQQPHLQHGLGLWGQHPALMHDNQQLADAGHPILRNQNSQEYPQQRGRFKGLFDTSTRRQRPKPVSNRNAEAAAGLDPLKEEWLPLKEELVQHPRYQGPPQPNTVAEARQNPVFEKWFEGQRDGPGQLQRLDSVSSSEHSQEIRPAQARSDYEDIEHRER